MARLPTGSPTSSLASATGYSTRPSKRRRVQGGECIGKIRILRLRSHSCDLMEGEPSTMGRGPYVSRSARAISIAASACVIMVSAGCISGNAAEQTGSGSTTAPETAPPNVQSEQFTPALMTVPTTPRWFTGTDGRLHLVYELQLTNAFPISATITEVAVRDAGNGTVLQTLSGDQLTAALSLLSSGGQPTTELAPSTVGVVWLDVPLDNSSSVPSRIDHQLTVTVPPGLPVPESITTVGGASDVDTNPPVVIGPPLEGGGWFAVGSCCDGPHRRTAQPINNQLWVAQRFAIDFNKINDQGFLVVGDKSKNESWPTYDQPVLAVADAEVTTAQDGFPDQIPEAPTPVTIDQADGNHVILKLADGTYAFYAHLKPGSVAVKAGDQVRMGQPIGRTGNSGSSTGAHLHFQLMDRPSALVADGLPYEFNSFTMTGRGPTLADLTTTDPATTPVAINTTGAGPRTDQLPLSADIVEFQTP